MNKRYFKAKYAGALINPHWVVLHHTSTLNDASGYLANPGDGRTVSVHFHINRKGVLTQYINLIMIDDKKVWKAAHAGTSEYGGYKNLNNSSIGIEIDGDGVTPFTKEQMATLTELCKELMDKFGFKTEQFVTHAMVATPRGRKDDPKPFDLEAFRKSLIKPENITPEIVKARQGIFGAIKLCYQYEEAAHLSQETRLALRALRESKEFANL